jgi:hypothetical protein
MKRACRRLSAANTVREARSFSLNIRPVAAGLDQ